MKTILAISLTMYMYVHSLLTVHYRMEKEPVEFVSYSFIACYYSMHGVVTVSHQWYYKLYISANDSVSNVTTRQYSLFIIHFKILSKNTNLKVNVITLLYKKAPVSISI